MPVGFVGAAESKEALIAERRASIIVRARAQRWKRDGRSVRSTPWRAEGMNAGSGRSMAIGLGPGDPELLTVKAVRLIAGLPSSPISPKPAGAATRARSSTAGSRANCERDAALLSRDDGNSVRPCRLQCRLCPAFYEASAETDRAAYCHRAATSRCSREGDPLFYGSFMHLYIRLRDRFRPRSSPASPAWPDARGGGAPMTWGDDVLTVLPGTLVTRRCSSRDCARPMPRSS